MNALFSFIQTLGVFLAGLALRFGVFVAVLLVLTAIFLVGLGVVRLAGWLHRRVRGLGAADGIAWKRSGYYAPGHTWIESLSGQAIRVGFDDLAQRILGQVTAITLPAPGATLKEGQPLMQVACGDRHATIPSPISGKVLGINDEVTHDPTLIHRDPYRRGWLVSVDAANTAYTRLLWGEPARRWLKEESVRLSRFMEQQLQMHAADGGELTAPGSSLLEAQQWEALTKSFLKTA